MTMKYEIQTDGKLLSARAWGVHKSVDELKQYGADLVAACIVGSCTKALLDERELEHTLDEGAIFRLAEQYSLRAPRLIKAAILFDPQERRNVDFWETCAVNRGLSLKAFTSREAAMEWLYDNDGDVFEECA